MRTVINYLKPQTGSLPSEIFGIDVAINNFLKAFFKYSRQKEFFFFPGSDESVQSLKDLAAEGGVDFSRCAWIGPGVPEMALSGVDLLFRPDPNLADHIWRRLQMKEKAYAVCSIVHTASGERIAGVIGDYLLAPTQEGDAIICPSTAIRDSIIALWEIQGSYYAHRFKGKMKCPVDLPVIPLGVHTDRFATVSTEEKRKEQRATLGIAEDETVILYVGRLSYATKAHPLALFKAAELAALQVAPKKIRLVLYGFFMPQAMETEFVRLAADACPHLAVDFISNNDPRFPDGVWAAGNIFASLIDNIQESFGFTPIEAMACGLPAVISDWDGYRDGVRHGVEGMLIPTTSVPPGHNVELAAHYYNLRNYGEYLIRNNQSVAVDIAAAAAAFVVLINNPGLREKLGSQGRIRAAEYDWRHIIKRYEDLWEELAAKRQRAKLETAAPANWPAVHPSYPDPSYMFRAFPSQGLTPELRLEMAGNTSDIGLASRHAMNLYGLDRMLSEDMMSEMIALLYKKPGASLAEIQKVLSIPDPPRFMRSVAWFLKMGLMRVVNS